jgi:hypothetical protein
MLNKDAEEGQSYWKDLTCFNNILRAFVVHPRYATKSAVRTAVGRLKALQTTAGDWGHQLPFYKIVNALAHLDLPQAAGVEYLFSGACAQKQKHFVNAGDDILKTHLF